MLSKACNGSSPVRPAWFDHYQPAEQHFRNARRLIQLEDVIVVILEDEHVLAVDRCRTSVIQPFAPNKLVDEVGVGQGALLGPSLRLPNISSKRVDNQSGSDHRLKAVTPSIS